MRRGIFILLLVLAVAGAVATASEVSAAQPAGEHVVLTPAEGTLTTLFVFVGHNFQPGRTVSVRITTPDGAARRFTTEEGAEMVWLVGRDGSFVVELVPSTRFPGALPGHWQVLFCSAGSPTCQQIDFDVLP